MPETYRGSCLCGEVRFSVTGFSQQAAHCHCSMCRKFHGAAFGTLVEVSDLNWLSGEPLIREFRADNGTLRSFCSQCGSSLGFRAEGTDKKAMEIAIACFDEPIPVQIDAHIYTRYRANWCELSDDLPKFAEGRDE
ncbi:GFA family protein [Neptuniibacter halophilus]|uniref:GFA family protein n=1 Tax=Neptuniibacter halophilus TaxID=651666 RepID=UPI00257301CA|nr:GFA family protein [Neptuniibacter halophilus]